VGAVQPGSQGKPFSPSTWPATSVPRPSLPRKGIHTLYEAIASTTHPKAQTFFNQWKILFGEVCGYDVDNPLTRSRCWPTLRRAAQGFQPAELLFAVHTYYAVFMKLLAAEIRGVLPQTPHALAKMMQATTVLKLKREMEELEAGGIFKQLASLIFWKATCLPGTCRLVRSNRKADPRHGRQTGRLQPRHTLGRPAGSRDLLKKLYQELFPKTVRRSTGEHYTPDWLAEHVLNEVGYTGDPDKRMLDPGCGSGTFLVAAINRIRAWYDKNREKCAFGDDDLCARFSPTSLALTLTHWRLWPPGLTTSSPSAT